MEKYNNGNILWSFKLYRNNRKSIKSASRASPPRAKTNSNKHRSVRNVLGKDGSDA